MVDDSGDFNLNSRVPDDQGSRYAFLAGLVFPIAERAGCEAAFDKLRNDWFNEIGNPALLMPEVHLPYLLHLKEHDSGVSIEDRRELFDGCARLLASFETRGVRLISVELDKDLPHTPTHHRIVEQTAYEELFDQVPGLVGGTGAANQLEWLIDGTDKEPITQAFSEAQKRQAEHGAMSYASSHNEPLVQLADLAVYLLRRDYVPHRMFNQANLGFGVGLFDPMASGDVVKNVRKIVL